MSYYDLLFEEMNNLHHRYELSETVSSDYFEPGMMEYLDKSLGIYDESTHIMTLRFQSKGTRYDGRTDIIEMINVGDAIKIHRDTDNVFNSNNFVILWNGRYDLGNMPKELCNAIAPLYDEGLVEFIDSSVSFVDPITKRNRHAKQGELFVELKMKLLGDHK